jgi:SAM-dependent methyltransferase
MAFWDSRYGEEGFAYGTNPNDFLLAQASQISASCGTVLCLAEGEGRNAVFLAEQGHAVTGVDSCDVGLAKARALAQERGVESRLTTVTCDLADYDLGVNKWDCIVSIFAHLPQPLRTKVHAAAVVSLKSGGVLILEAYTPKQLEFKTGGPQTVDMAMTLDDLKVEFSGLDFVVAEEKVREVHEGKYHNGTSAVVQIIGRKP